ncbi:unnamed protein product, partial [Protopolystoma xenopodis]
MSARGAQPRQGLAGLQLGLACCALLFCLFVELAAEVGQKAKEASGKKPVIVQYPRDNFLLEGGLVEFMCRAEGDPKPLIRWYHADTGQPVQDQAPQTSGGSTDDSGTAGTGTGGTNGVGDQAPQTSGGSTDDSGTAGTGTGGTNGVGGGGIAAQHGGPGLHVNQHHGQLMLTDLRAEASYAFYCNASNPHGWVVSPRVVGGIAFLADEFARQPLDKTVREGDRVILECSPPRGQPTPRVEWRRDDRSVAELPASRRSSTAGAAAGGGGVEAAGSGLLVLPHRAQFTESSLTLVNVTPADAGVYACEAPGGQALAEAKLTVQSAPAFLRTPEEQTAREGDTVEFHCESIGYPRPSVYWETPSKLPLFPPEDGQAVGDQPAKYLLHPSGRLVIFHATRADEGQYTCTAHSSVNTVSSSALLRVLPARHRPPVPPPGVFRPGQSGQPGHLDGLGLLSPRLDDVIAPVIILPPANQTLLLDQTATLQCDLGATRQPNGLLSGAAGRSGVVVGPRVVWLRATRATGGLHEQLDEAT